jgi:predicted transcriptional regulator
MNRYEEGNMVEREDIEASSRILKATFEGTREALSGVGLGAYQKAAELIQKHLKKHPEGRTHTQVLQNVSWKFRKDTVDKVLEQMWDSGLIKVKKNGTTVTRPTFRGQEHYQWRME